MVQEQATVADVGKTVQSPARVVTRHASDLANTKSAGKALKGCFVAGTQVVVGSEEIAALYGAEEHANIYYIGAGIVMASAAVFMGQRRKQEGSGRKPISHKKTTTDPENVSSGNTRLPEKADVLCETHSCEHKPSSSHQGRKFFYTASSLICLLLMLAFFWMAWPQNGKTVSADSASPSGSRYLTKNIEDLSVGLVIPAHNPEGGETDELNSERPNAATWRKLSLFSPKQDGTISEITLLRPLWWLEEQRAEIGSEVWVEVPECGISGWAKLLSVEPCPVIEDADGRVVTGTFKHYVTNVLDIWIEGEPEPIGTTPNHPFWNEEAGNFVRADQLAIGSTLRRIDQTPAKVERIEARSSQSHIVYNLEVHSQHTYFVGQNGVLVHNSTINPCGAQPTFPTTGWGNIGSHDPVREYFDPLIIFVNFE